MVEDSITLPEKAVVQDDGAFSGQNNAQVLSALLNALEKVSLRQRDKCTRFERLVMDYFKYDRKIVDFINHSVNDLLQKEFGCSLSSKDVHILDPFTGAGTFITRMMLDPELIKPEDLERKYKHELHAYEIMLLAYYVASINMEAAMLSLPIKHPMTMSVTTL